MRAGLSWPDAVVIIVALLLDSYRHCSGGAAKFVRRVECVGGRFGWRNRHAGASDRSDLWSHVVVGSAVSAPCERHLHARETVFGLALKLAIAASDPTTTEVRASGPE